MKIYFIITGVAVLILMICQAIITSLNKKVTKILLKYDQKYIPGFKNEIRFKKAFKVYNSSNDISIEEKKLLKKLLIMKIIGITLSYVYFIYFLFFFILNVIFHKNIF